MSIRSACYLQGNKYLLWEEIKHYLKAETRSTLVEPFFGSGTVSLNAANETLFKHMIGSDIAKWQIDLHKAMQDPMFVFAADKINKAYSEDLDGFLQMKESYNKDISDMGYLYNLMCRANSNMTRFSGKEGSRKYNMSYGKRARFSVERLMQNQVLMKGVDLYNMSFGVLFLQLESLLSVKGVSPLDTTIYVDSPYYNSVATYNEQGGWTAQDDEVLLDYLVKLHKQGYHIVSSNAFHNRGKTNSRLIEWTEANSELFEVVYLNRDYSNSSYFKSDHPTVEVLIVSK